MKVLLNGRTSDLQAMRANVLEELEERGNSVLTKQMLAWNHGSQPTVK